MMKHYEYELLVLLRTLEGTFEPCRLFRPIYPFWWWPTLLLTAQIPVGIPGRTLGIAAVGIKNHQNRRAIVQCVVRTSRKVAFELANRAPRRVVAIATQVTRTTVIIVIACGRNYRNRGAQFCVVQPELIPVTLLTT